MLSKDSLLQQFKENIPAWRSESTLYRYPQLVSHFIDYVGVKQVYNRADAMKFLNHIINSGLSKNYATWSGYVLKQFYVALGITFPLKAGDLPKPDLDEVVAPVFSADYVCSFIEVIKSKGTPMMKAYLAFSTTYGFRRQELANVTSKDIYNGTIRVPTVKGKVVRQHIIPDEIAPYLASFEFKPVNPQTMINLFLRMQVLAKLKHGEREGFHSIRRSLVTELLGAGVPVHIVYQYMGWKLGFRLGIVGVYAKPDPQVTDQKVLAAHPFLAAWR